MTVDLSSFSVKPVPEHEDLIAFGYDFSVKALTEEADVVTTEDNGDLIIEGWAADFSGVDRQGENFADGAFQRGIKSFLEGAAALCFHHKTDKVLGKVLDLQEVEGKGLKMRARVDGAIRQHPELGTYYEQIKNGTLKGLSVGGFFKRKLTELGPRIIGVDFTEVSVTGVPVHPAPSFAVVAGKALSIEMPKVPKEVKEADDLRDEDKFMIEEAIRILNNTFDSITKRGKKPEPEAAPTITQL
jgi:HK97 family phage prohead protease